MGRSVEKTGKTVNDAIAAALGELKLSIDEVHVDVLNEGKTGLLGLLSARSARVRVSELDEDERVAPPGYAGARDGAAAVAKPAVGREGAAGAAGFGAAADRKAAANAANADDDDEDNIGDDDEGEWAQGEDGDGGEDADDYAGDGQPNDEAAEDGSYNGEADSPDAYPAGDSDIDYGTEVNRAVEYLGEIFKGIHVFAKMNVEPAEDGFMINIESDDSGILIGHRGETLDALQYLVNLYMNKGRNDFIRVFVDIENYKKKREAALVRLAGQMADKVVRLRRNFALDPMNSYERRIIHSVLQSHPKVETYSVGEEPNRKVVVTLKNRGGYSPR